MNNNIHAPIIDQCYLKIHVYLHIYFMDGDRMDEWTLYAILLMTVQIKD